MQGFIRAPVQFRNDENADTTNSHVRCSLERIEASNEYTDSTANAWRESRVQCRSCAWGSGSQCRASRQSFRHGVMGRGTRWQAQGAGSMHYVATSSTAATRVGKPPRHPVN